MGQGLLRRKTGRRKKGERGVGGGKKGGKPKGREGLMKDHERFWGQGCVETRRVKNYEERCEKNRIGEEKNRKNNRGLRKKLTITSLKKDI